MTREGEELTADRLQVLLRELSDSLQSRGLTAQLFIVGGAAMALGYDRQRLTRDVDAVFEPAPEVRQIAAEIGERHGLEPDWLNDGAKGFMPRPDGNSRVVFESESLYVQVPSPEFLLAMKLHASRDDRDFNDAATLFNEAGYTDPQQAIDLLDRSYPPQMLQAKHRYVVDDVAHRAKALRHLSAEKPRHPRTLSERIEERVNALREQSAEEHEARQDRGPESHRRR
ncbi:DUF6036 family nucleotidyltransferase [Microbacterium sp. Leaf151]|uniref:DUF6036 family nucleotidyltransferase n=1 Tax=Microbacterium sp. Leaf151 TaxID=1736276 RepID=UPI000A87D0E9|nr:DUF6036 family nucleotidyltransferase [Microbacterium sp. Leaf151]